MASSPVHLTRIEDVVVHDSGWVELPGTSFDVVRLPLIDAATSLASGRQLFARLTYRAALEWCAEHACALIDGPTLDLYRKASITLRPVLLPDSDQRRAVPRRPGESAQAWDGRLRSDMTSIAWSERHDFKVWQQLDALGWDGTSLVFGAGKHWISGARAGRAWLMGWWRGGETPPKNEYWQNPPLNAQGPHDDGHHDYGTTTLVVRDRAPIRLPAD